MRAGAGRALHGECPRLDGPFSGATLTHLEPPVNIRRGKSLGRMAGAR